MPIASPQNQRIKDAIKLRDRRQRTKQDRTIIEGSREIGRAIEGGVELAEVFVCREFCHTDESGRLLSLLAETDAPLVEVTAEVFARLAFGQRAEGAVAVARMPRHSLADLTLAPNPLVAVVEGVEKPGNLGAVLRSADAAGVSAVIAAGHGTDLYNPNVIRASLGVVFTLPVCAATSAEAWAWLSERGFTVYAARVDAVRAYSDIPYTGPTAIVLGSEAAGLSSVWSGEGVTPIKLPMLGAADSLNISAAAAVLFYEALRQRTAAAAG
jgi:RNA methyltransferase, TrmH family